MIPKPHPALALTLVLAGSACVAVAFAPRLACAAAPIAPRLAHAAATAGVHDPLLLWVYFADRPSAAGVPSVSARSLARRAKVGAALRASDLPVDPAAVARLRPHVRAVRQRSRWLNAASVVATRADLEPLSRLPGVRRLDLVGRARRNGTEAAFETRPAPPGAPPARTAGEIDYGPAVAQLGLIGIPGLHARGYTGQGVLVAHFDNGLRLLSHEVFASLQVEARHDFVDGDEDPAPPAGAPSGWGAHGIYTLSVLAGYRPGRLVGAAFGARYVLARTENDGSETPLEEDNWVAAVEWADSIGVDVVSSSLGYLEYDPPTMDWTWEDMDGNTTAITRAADMAVARGIVVVNAVGNQGFHPDHNTLVAPADGDSVLAVGGVWPDPMRQMRYDSASIGPTTSTPPRIKPDILAQGTAIWVAGASTTGEYGYNSGTSFACPAVAGLVALLLEAAPSATPMQIAAALRGTADRATTPDRLFGYGIVDAEAALAELTTAVERKSISQVKSLYR